MLREHGGSLGGEASGHLLCLDRSNTGDAIVAALQVLVALRRAEQSLAAALADYQHYPQILKNVVLKERRDLSRHPELIAAVAVAEQELDGKGRVLLRPSGTEPLFRVMVEGENAALVANLVERLSAVVQRIAS
jgi:phosphoglucosamine mutase